MNSTQPIFLYDNATIRWHNGDKLYCLHVQRDDAADSPRKWDGQVTTMACWHSRYRLGDEIPDGDAEDYWRRLARENVSASEIFEAAKTDKLPGIRLTKNAESESCWDIYETYMIRTVLGSSKPEECLEYEGVPEYSVADYLLDDLTIRHCMALMEPYAEWLPMFLYDHSGLTISCGARLYPYSDRWDSSAVGWVVALKKTLMDNQIGTESTWRERAAEIMKADVEVYDQYLTGEVYGYTLYEADMPENADEPIAWEEIHSCWGFYGDDLLKNGMCENAGLGLKDALKAGRYECGTAQLCTYSYYKFQ